LFSPLSCTVLPIIGSETPGPHRATPWLTNIFYAKILCIAGFDFSLTVFFRAAEKFRIGNPDEGGWVGKEKGKRKKEKGKREKEKDKSKK
jgi:hypothetical protein